MSMAELEQQASRSASFRLDLSSSNNPFLRSSSTPPIATASDPARLPNSPVSPFDDPPPRPVSRNPFLDPAFSSDNTSRAMSPTAGSGGPLTVDEIFGSLTFNDNTTLNSQFLNGKRESDRAKPVDNTPKLIPIDSPSCGDAVHSRRPQSNRPSHRSEDSSRTGRQPRPGTDGASFTGSPEKPHDSDSSALKMDVTEEEWRAILSARRRRAAKKLAEDRRIAEAKKQTVAKDKVPKTDVIDGLDFTTEGKYHHGGPFDAVNPVRNHNARAPMKAFPEGSLNNSLSGPMATNSHMDIMGLTGNEAFSDYAKGSMRSLRNGNAYPESAKSEVPIFDPLAGDTIHGDQSVGLGTSTFLQGTPAARTAIERRMAEETAEPFQRKPSIAKRIMAPKANRGHGPHGSLHRMNSADDGSVSDMTPVSGGALRDPNPFFTEYSRGSEKLDAKPKSPPMTGPTSPVSPYEFGQKPIGGLERRATVESIREDDVQPKPIGGLLSRVKSLKGKRRPSDAQQQQSPPGAAN